VSRQSTSKDMGAVRETVTNGLSLMLMLNVPATIGLVVLAEPIPNKGRVLTAMTAFWVEHLGDVLGNHLLSTDLDHGIGEVESLGLMDDATSGNHLAVHDRRQELDGKRHGHDEGIGDQRLHGEERRVVEHLEVDRAVRGVRGVMHIRPDRHPYLGEPPVYVNGRPEELIYRPVHVHRRETLEMIGHAARW